MLGILFSVAQEVLTLFKWAVILAAVFSMLTSFGVLDTRNRLVWGIGDFLFRVTEPALRPIRNLLPRFGSIDLSPLVLILVIWAAQEMLARVYISIETGSVQPLLF